ncbi:hypothetical protein NDU88_003974 [Pleurodeles waltl]|uniref:Uncharacterized protein n=1 Tax=Pleurodeles waltl TaxID=8319 RepID=A0AAV7UZY6_PLEWA|nr:hypothetical protein NDU88_003974 [Pleurodeles waltl]
MHKRFPSACLELDGASIDDGEGCVLSLPVCTSASLEPECLSRARGCSCSLSNVKAAFERRERLWKKNATSL